MLFKTIQITLFSSLAIASPITSNNLILGRATQPKTIVGGISGALTDCSTAPFPAECATLTQAAKGITIAFGNKEFTAAEMPRSSGQGTKNMQMAKIIFQYDAQSIPIPPIKNPPRKDPPQLPPSMACRTTRLNEIRALVLVLTTLKTGTVEGWQAYMKCVGVDPR
ncbi:uncharacterized protein EAF02_008175 [Botrytis sinoallii]|uniref:uncharacterized protein n=1 Tax=Botrytis sinoallii TaxID=1463999 RepID=UPI0018FF846E|nr:uncharacterized protein EAF02_008175 [Botrytis sinoallii]KAF7876955.1 hypothetical protein EAF02_008175 [Botrytis sinoallii]